MASITKNSEMITENNVKRIKYVDIAKGLAIICVVLCHSVEAAYVNIEWTTLSNISKVFKILTFTIGRIGVPLFVLSSGVLLLNRKFENDRDIINFYKKNLIPLLVVTEIWNIIYYIFMKIWYSQAFDIKEFLEILFFLRNSNSPNMWYMPMILGIYIAVPFLSVIVHKFSFKTIKIPIIIGMICSIVVPSISVIIGYKIPRSTVIDISFLGGVYGVYLILGYYINNTNIMDKISKLKICIIVAIELGILVFTQIFLLNKNIKYNLWYNFLPLMLLACTIFILLKKLDNVNEKIYNIFYKLAKQTLAIFFIHMLIKYIVQGYINELNIMNPIKTIIIFIVIFILSVLIIKIIGKSKLAKKYLLLIK